MLEADRTAEELGRIIDDVLELTGLLRASGDQLASVAGQTRARWQLLKLVAHRDLTVSQAARRLDKSRQATQRVADLLAQDDALRYQPNPDHQRSPLLRLTPKGADILTRIEQASAQKAKRAAPDFTLTEITTARSVLRRIIESHR